MSLLIGAPCGTSTATRRPTGGIAQRDITTGKARLFSTAWDVAFSPDFSRAAFVSSSAKGDVVRVRDLATNAEWVALLPPAPGSTSERPVTSVTDIAFGDRNDRVVVLVEGDAGMRLDELQLPAQPGAFRWGHTVATVSPYADGLAATADALDVFTSHENENGTFQGALDAYDWTYQRVAHTSLAVVPSDVAIVNGTRYVVGADATLAEHHALYRVAPDGHATLVQPHIVEVAPVGS